MFVLFVAKAGLIKMDVCFVCCDGQVEVRCVFVFLVAMSELK